MLTQKTMTNIRASGDQWGLSIMKSQEHTNGRHINSRAIAKCHVQHVHNCLIGIRTLKLRTTGTRHHKPEM